MAELINEWFYPFVWVWIGVAVVTFLVLLKVTAPYGRHTTGGWGPMISNRLGWIIMELPSLLTFGLFFLLGPNEKTSPMWLFFALWVAHYINRSLVFPFRIKTQGKKMPFSIAASAIFFNLINGFTNGYFLGTYCTPYPEEYWLSANMIGGLVLFIVGACINIYSDQLLLDLRKPGETGYKIPQGGLFRWVSSPNLFGEMIEWIGFAVMVGALPAWGFAIWTIANLLPRALEHHKFYLKRFPDYPKERKAVIPGLL